MRLVLFLSLATGCSEGFGTTDKGPNADADTAHDNDGDADTDTDTDSDTDVSFASLCGAEPGFSDPGATEYLQWFLAGAENVSRPYPGGVYVYNGQLSVSLYDGTTFAALGFYAANGIGEGLAAGTYNCLDDPDRFYVNGGSAGAASPDFANSACLVRLDEDVSDGGTVSGALTAQLADYNGNQTGCVDARFFLTDAPP